MQSSNWKAVAIYAMVWSLLPIPTTVAVWWIKNESSRQCFAKNLLHTVGLLYFDCEGSAHNCWVEVFVDTQETTLYLPTGNLFDCLKACFEAFQELQYDRRCTFYHKSF